MTEDQATQMIQILTSIEQNQYWLAGLFSVGIGLLVVALWFLGDN